MRVANGKRSAWTAAALLGAACVVVAAVGVPLASQAREQAALERTSSGMAALARSLAQRACERGSLPIRPAAQGTATDAWGRALALSIDSEVLRVASMGPDGRPGTVDDLEHVLHLGHVRRETTLARLGVIQRAIARYNERHQLEYPLPGSWPLALERLVANGYLPPSPDWRVDGWGDAFLEAPRGSRPLVRVESRNLALADEDEPARLPPVQAQADP